MKKSNFNLLVFFILAFSYSYAYCQLTFSDPKIIKQPMVYRPKSVFSCDIDGDGRFDILSASYYDNKIAWYKNIDNNNNFSDQKLISTDLHYPELVSAADLDSDGDMDVISVSNQGRTINWFENINGLGNFSDLKRIPGLGGGIRSIFHCDIDNDGDIDILTPFYNDNKIVWYENIDGFGNFKEPKEITSLVKGPTSVFCCDVDNDGDMDVLSSSSADNKIALYENIDGKANFGVQKEITTSAMAANFVNSADLDGDGDLDVIESSNNVAWYENLNGSGNFSEKKVILSERTNYVYCFDIDNDGDKDVISAYVKDIYLNENLDGSGNYGEPINIGESAVGRLFIFPVDFNNDKNIDILFSSSWDNKIAWYENLNIHNSFIEHQITSSVDQLKSIYAEDLDNDGDLDVLSASFRDNKIAWYENIDGIGNFSKQKIISTLMTGANFVYASDINNDKNIDVLSASYFGFAWHLNIDGFGNFEEPRFLLNQSNDVGISIFSCDINGDGYLDILAGGGSSITWYNNIDGLGNFSEQRITTLGSGPINIFYADIDGDYDLDVIAASYKDDTISWYENINGLGNFSERNVISSNTILPRSIYACDIDGDNDMDVLTVSYGANKVLWYENINGLGNFGEENVISDSAYNARSVFSCDLDNDGDMDVLSASSADNKIAWYENINGLGHFSGQKIISRSAQFASFVYSCDIDNDGDSDVLSCSEGDGKIAWYENYLFQTVVMENSKRKPLNYRLFQNYPNPFNPMTRIKYELPNSTHITLKIYNIMGQEIETLVDEFQISGEHEITWNPLGIPSGLYFYKINSGDITKIKKLILQK